jgi:hypothetical protein
MEQAHIVRKEVNICSLAFYQDVLVSFLSIKMFFFPSFLSRCACSLPFYQNMLVHFLSNNMFEKKGTSIS